MIVVDLEISVFRNSTRSHTSVPHCWPSLPAWAKLRRGLPHHPNYDAARLVLGDVYPTIAQAVSECRLRVTGRQSSADLAALLRAPGVHSPGYVAAIRPIVIQNWAAVVPFRADGRTRHKILEPMALGTSPVSTAQGAEHIDVTHGENLLITDDPTEFGVRTLAPQRSPGPGQRLTASGRKRLEAHLGWRTTGERPCSVREHPAA